MDTYKHTYIHTYIPQEVDGTLIGEEGFVVMAGAESVECYQIHQTYGFHVFDAIPFAPFQTSLRAVLPSAASTDTYIEAELVYCNYKRLGVWVSVCTGGTGG